MKYTRFIGFLSIAGLLGSCATTADLAKIEARQSQTEQRVAEFDKKYQEILAENNLFKDKLKNQVPITYVESNGILFEVMKVYRDGKQTIVEMALTQKGDSDCTIQINSLQVTVTDEIGTPAKVLGFRYKGESRIQPNFYNQLIPGSPYRLELVLENLSSTAEGIGLIGLEQISNITRNTKFNVALKHVRM